MVLETGQMQKSDAIQKCATAVWLLMGSSLLNSNIKAACLGFNMNEAGGEVI